MYGLFDPPRAWYLRIKDVIEMSDMLKSTFEEAIFYWLSNGKLEGVLYFLDDDFIWGDPINTEFLQKKEKKKKFK